MKKIFDIDRAINNITNRNDEFLKILNENEMLHRIDLTLLMQICNEEYQKMINDGYIIKIVSPITLLNILAEMVFFNDFADMISASEQIIHNNKKICYIDFYERDNIDINSIINDFDDDDDDDKKNSKTNNEDKNLILNSMKTLSSIEINKNFFDKN